jgi:chromosome partitioning protein
MDIDNYLHLMQNIKKLDLAPVFVGLNQKGGVGKTFLTNAIGTVCAYAGLKVCIIETCEQKNSVLNLAKNRTLVQTKMPGILQLMIDPGHSLKELVIPTKIPNLFVMPADKGMNNYFTQNFGNKKIFPHGYDTVFKAMENLRKAFDVIIIDSPPNEELLPMLVSASSTHYFYLRDSDMTSADGVVQMFNAMTKIQKSMKYSGACLGILMNDVRSSPKACQLIVSGGGMPPLMYMNYIIPYSRKPVTYASTNPKSFWLKNAFKGQAATSPIEQSIYGLTCFLLQEAHMVEEETFYV